MAVLRCDACGGDTFEALAETGFFRCHNCGAASSVKLAAAAAPRALTGIQLISAGPTKIQVIKVIREYTGLGLKEAKDVVDACESRPQTISLSGGDPSALERLAADLTAAHAVIQRS